MVAFENDLIQLTGGRNIEVDKKCSSTPSEDISSQFVLSRGLLILKKMQKAKKLKLLDVTKKVLD